MNATTPAAGIRTGFRLTTLSRDTLTDNMNFGPVRDALDAAADDADLKNRTLCLWEIIDTGKPSIMGGTVQDWRLVTLVNPAPQQYRTLHDAECDPEEQGYCSCKRRMPVDPPAWVNLFAGHTLSSMFYLSPQTRAQLTALRWPFPENANQWTYPGVADTDPDATPDATSATEPTA
ncbi:hypothetical protein [Kitasatospora viridis]|uniref:Uncharacterized protein n=1 Tax=Kitasatospora viridis TaxID=281105 RepID=A0A561SA17_9ACTN|nr:hypothetical protein [Kitasatospora viridis]TWF71718.1 hypothetical protein FHX73_1889 [Kitasatospora viridis]